MKKYHYVYELRFINGIRYIGKRSCNCLPDEDINYRGSSKHTPKDIHSFKCILQTYNSAEEALLAEVRLHRMYNVKDHKDFYNQANQTSTKFRVNSEVAQKTASKLRGRKAKDYEYISIANKKRRLLRGDNQTPAQKEGNISMGLWNKGRKNPAKGKSNTDNSGFHPWYYITPDGVKVEVYNTTKANLAHKFNVTKRQFYHRFHHSNIGKCASPTDKRLPEGIRGYTFGNLESDKN